MFDIFPQNTIRLGNKELYCVIKLREVEKVVFCNSGFFASSLVRFLISENCFFTLPAFLSNLSFRSKNS